MPNAPVRPVANFCGLSAPWMTRMRPAPGSATNTSPFAQRAGGADHRGRSPATSPRNPPAYAVSRRRGAWRAGTKQPHAHARLRQIGRRDLAHDAGTIRADIAERRAPVRVSACAGSGARRRSAGSKRFKERAPWSSPLSRARENGAPQVLLARPVESCVQSSRRQPHHRGQRGEQRRRRHQHAELQEIPAAHALALTADRDQPEVVASDPVTEMFGPRSTPTSSAPLMAGAAWPRRRPMRPQARGQIVHEVAPRASSRPAPKPVCAARLAHIRTACARADRRSRSPRAPRRARRAPPPAAGRSSSHLSATAGASASRPRAPARSSAARR